MNQIDNIMALADEYAHAHAKFWLESLYGTSKPYTADCKEERDEQQQALRAAIEAALGSGEPVAWGMQNDDGQIYDCITPEEHARLEGEYTVPLYTAAPQPQPAQRTAGCTLCGYCAATGEKLPKNDTALLKQALESLKELVPDPQCDFGPAYTGAKQRRKQAITALKERLK